MTRRRAYLHLGLDDGSGDVVTATLAQRRHALAELGVRSPDDDERLLRAAAELLHAHAEWGYRRTDVEGSWTRLVEACRAGHDTVVISLPPLAAADPGQAALALDALAGFEVHLVVTVHAPDAWTLAGDAGRDLGPVLERWSAAFPDRRRIHVLVTDDDATTWRELGRLAGFGTRSVPAATGGVRRLRVTHPVPASRRGVAERLAATWAELLREGGYDVRGDLRALTPTVATEPDDDTTLLTALAEVERLQRRSEALEGQVLALRGIRARERRRQRTLGRHGVEERRQARRRVG